MTFEESWRLAHLEAPAVPPLLMRSWLQEGFAKLCEHWGWSFLRSEGTISILASRAITATLTIGSATVTSSTAGFVATDAGRQIRVGRLPIYTIISVAAAGSATLDRAYTEATATDTAATIQDCYFTAPSDFKRFEAIYDRYNQRPIPFWFSADQLAVADPARQISDTDVRYLVAQKYSPATATLGRARFEYWPAPTAVRTYPFLYIRKADTLADASALPGVLSERGDLLKTYALYRAAMWPGTAELPNPFRSATTAATLKLEWEEEKNKLELSDDNQYPQQLAQVDWARRVGAITQTASLLRQTDATLADYY